NDAGHQVSNARRVERTEAQRVEHRDRSRAHGEDVTENAADAGGRALIRLDGGRMVVRLDLERHGESVTDRDHAGVLTGTLQHVRRRGREFPEQGPRMFVRAVLAPQRAHDAEFRERRRAAQHVHQAIVLVPREPMLGNECRRDRGIAGAGSRGQGFLVGAGAAFLVISGTFAGAWIFFVSMLFLGSGSFLAGGAALTGAGDFAGAAAFFAGGAAFRTGALPPFPFAIAASADTGAGDELFPVYLRALERNTPSTTFPLSSATMSLIPIFFS